MSSKLWATGASDESSSEGSDDEQQPKSQGPNRFLVRDAFDEEDDDERRVVKSKREKIFDEFKAIAKQMLNKANIGDWSNVENEYSKLLLSVKAGVAVVKEHGLPGALYKTLMDVDAKSQNAWENKAKLNKLVFKSLNNLRTKLKKGELATYYPAFQEAFDRFKKNPVVEASEPSESEEEEEEEEESDEESEDEKPVKKAPAAPKAKPKKGSDEESDSEDDIDWGTETESESESDGEDKEMPLTLKYKLSDFLKKGPADKEKDKKKKPKVRPAPVLPVDPSPAPATDANTPYGDIFGTEKVTFEVVVAKMKEVLSNRGRKGVSTTNQIALIRRIREIVAIENLGLGLSLKLLSILIASYFDDAQTISGAMRPVFWTGCHDAVMELFFHMFNSPNVVVLNEVEDEKENYTDAAKPYLLGCNIVNFTERLDDEFTKSLQAMDPHATDYVDRLKDEPVIYNLICLCEKLIAKSGPVEALHRLALRRVEHIYYRREYKYVNHRFLAADRPSYYMNAVSADEAVEGSKALETLCRGLYAQSDNRLRTRAILCHIFYLALTDRWFEARDLMLMSHLQESIGHADLATQILYNRTMVQLGLCAFRKGFIAPAHAALHDIWSGGHVKELLAQGINLRDKSPEDIKIEKRRQVPFHMHINVELIESVYYICSMLLEMPVFAQGNEMKHKISKPFRRLLDSHQRQSYQGPPENSREHIMAAATAMKSGDWRGCYGYIAALKIWSLVPGAEGVKEMLKTKIKEESARTYLFAFTGFYDSVSLVTLSEMFDLDEKTIHRIVSKLIINDELKASHDQPTQSLVMHKTEPSRLQAIALQFADKIGNVVESNERLVDTRMVQGFQGKERPQWNSRGPKRYPQQQHQNASSSSQQGSTPSYNASRPRGGYRRGVNAFQAKFLVRPQTTSSTSTA